MAEWRQLNQKTPLKAWWKFDWISLEEFSYWEIGDLRLRGLSSSLVMTETKNDKQRIGNSRHLNISYDKLTILVQCQLNWTIWGKITLQSRRQVKEDLLEIKVFGQGCKKVILLQTIEDSKVERGELVSLNKTRKGRSLHYSNWGRLKAPAMEWSLIFLIKPTAFIEKNKNKK